VQIFGEHKDNGNNSNGKKHSECNRPATLYIAGIFKYIPPMENSRASYNADMCLYGRCSVAVRCWSVLPGCASKTRKNPRLHKT